MKSKIVRMSLFLVALLFLTGCLGPNEADNADGNGQVLGDDDPGESISVPPGLRIQVGDETLEPVLGTYSWSVENEEGTITTIQADSAAPPEIARTMEPMPVTADTVIEFGFEEEPDRYTVRIWNEYTAVSESDDVNLSGEGEIIYEVLAHWEQGTASYTFSLTIE